MTTNNPSFNATLSEQDKQALMDKANSHFLRKQAAIAKLNPTSNAKSSSTVTTSAVVEMFALAFAAHLEIHITNASLKIWLWGLGVVDFNCVGVGVFDQLPVSGWWSRVVTEGASSVGGILIIDLWGIDGGYQGCITCAVVGEGVGAFANHGYWGND